MLITKLRTKPKKIIASNGEKSIGIDPVENLSCSFLNGSSIGSITTPSNLETVLLLGGINQDINASTTIKVWSKLINFNIIVIAKNLPPTLQLY